MMSHGGLIIMAYSHPNPEKEGKNIKQSGFSHQRKKEVPTSTGVQLFFTPKWFIKFQLMKQKNKNLRPFTYTQ